MIAAVIGVFCGMGPLAAGRADRGAPDVSVLLDTYAAGEFQSAVDAATGDDWKSSIPALRAALKRDGPGWAAREGPEREPRRQLIAATFALEAAHQVYVDLQRRTGLGPLQGAPEVRVDLHLSEPYSLPGWNDVEPLIEWACGWLRQRAPVDSLERDWFIASVQVLRDFKDPAVARERWDGQYRSHAQIRGHLSDALDRFPDEPWFRVVAAERWATSEEEVQGRRGPLTATLDAAFHGRSWPATHFSPESIAEILGDLAEMRKELTPLQRMASYARRLTFT